MSSADRPPPPCTPPASLKGVLVVYEDDNGNQQCKWLNLKAINGITWCPEDPPQRPHTPPKKPLPTVPNGPDLSDCVTHAAPPGGDNGGGLDADRLMTDPPLCWWTGSSWECGQV